MKSLFAAPLALSFALALSGCSPIADYVTIVRANHLHDRGLYEDAAAAYLSVHRPSFEPTVDYDLADVYARLGETAAASELYARARLLGDPGLQADSYFNEGVALYERSRYEEAWRFFRSALSAALAGGGAESGRFAAAARRNLELSWNAWKKRSAAPPRTAAPSDTVRGSQDDSELRLLRRLETGRWKPGSTVSPPPSAGDY
ncbi:MAG TPA: tetratricopeptide repeat protein [Rectinemataceae bacterium]|nr:tetratricopeptide repeat protein [Rectinemataceae bacterium]